MGPSYDALDQRLAWAQDVSAQVGRLLLSRQGRGVVAHRKDRGIVTALDRQAEQLVADSLRDAFPGDGLMAEEGTSRPAQGPWRWVADPLDGTTNYVAGLPMFAVSLACLDAEGTALGIVHAPALGETFQAVRDPAPVAPAAGPDALGDAVFIVNKAYAPAPTLWGVAGELVGALRAFRMFGCVSLDLALVASGRSDGLVLLPADPWDVAAGLLLVERAGLQAVDLDGRDTPDGRRGILATGRALSDPALNLLHPEALAT